MEIYDKLKALADTAPAGLSDAELTDWCNEAQNQWVHIGRGPLLKWCAKNNIISKVRAASKTPVSARSQSFSDVLLVLINGEGLDATDSAIRSLMVALRSDGVISQAEIDELIAIGQIQVPKAQAQVGWPGLVTIHDIEHVRTL